MNGIIESVTQCRFLWHLYGHSGAVYHLAGQTVCERAFASSRGRS